MLDARGLAFSHAWETEREDRSQLRARIMGGCSAHNACVVLEGASADYDEWGQGWGDDAIRLYLKSGPASTKQTCRPLSLRRAATTQPAEPPPTTSTSNVTPAATPADDSPKAGRH
jgi:choline dehydrogenase-like flavoprotein